jgi:hypothetical protein
MRAIWRFLLECLEALAQDDRERRESEAREFRDKQKRHLSYLGSGHGP